MIRTWTEPTDVLSVADPVMDTGPVGNDAPSVGVLSTVSGATVSGGTFDTVKTTFGVELSMLPAASMACTRIWKSPGTVLALGVQAHVQPVERPPGVSSVVSQYRNVELKPDPDAEPLQ